MYLFDLQRKLQKLNPELYVDTRYRQHVKDDIFLTFLHRRRSKRIKEWKDSLLNSLDGAAQKLVQAEETGAANEHVCNVPINFVPEYDLFDLKTKKLLLKGWRSILMELARKRYISLERARKVFSCSSLGNQPYDHLERSEKIRWQRGERFEKIHNKLG